MKMFSLSFLKKIIFFVFLGDWIHDFLYLANMRLIQKLNLQRQHGYLITSL